MINARELKATVLDPVGVLAVALVGVGHAVAVAVEVVPVGNEVPVGVVGTERVGVEIIHFVTVPCLVAIAVNVGSVGSFGEFIGVEQSVIVAVKVNDIEEAVVVGISIAEGVKEHIIELNVGP